MRGGGGGGGGDGAASLCRRDNYWVLEFIPGRISRDYIKRKNRARGGD